MKSALDTALTYLSRRALTHYELKLRLEKKEYSETEIQEAMERVEGWGYVNDQVLALSFAQTKLVSSSRKRVKQELLRRGVAPLLVEEALEQVFEPAQELSQCLDLAKKMWTQEGKRWETSYQYKKTYAHFPRELFLKQKIGQKLAQKGYPLEVISRVLEKSSSWN
ncbi:regulatory protein RecX [Desulfitobacterium sp.]|uniref:regulatory protein RecX n=1 Tax=Desulfitobacterium sp. TaxID=49981 RepID=UPI002BA63C37|nr:RecX family transcriptional regulator [Desulfitobacterium sp.]HVJ50512.1 RecX family transcriptional regulator [Desulfitobacterium sp.]